MGIYVNPGKDGFQSALNSEIYIDKTGLLAYTNRVLGTEQRYISISRPRRFGKSITAEMLTAYYGRDCDSEKMFEGLEIAGKAGFKKHLNQYDVIHIDVNTFLSEAANAKEAVQLLQTEIIRELKQEFAGSIGRNTEKLPMALAEVNRALGKKFVVVIDEWDAIFREDKHDKEAQELYIELLRGLFKNAPSKKFILLAYLTGILPIKKYGTQSALNNFYEFTMLQPSVMAQYAGFTEDEVAGLCKKYDMDRNEIKQWYDGYFLRGNLHIYSPNSIINAMLRGEYANYWSQTESFSSLCDYITMNFDGLKDAVVHMLGGEHIRIDSSTFENDMTSFKNRDDVLTVLVHLGYLAYDEAVKEAYIPNEEVRQAFQSAMKLTKWENVLSMLNASDDLLRATWKCKGEKVAEMIEQVHRDYVSVLKYNDENSLSCVITLAYFHAIDEYHVFREFPSGEGFADIVFLPRKHSDKPAMVVELKYNQSAQGAIAQIKDRKYAGKLVDGNRQILLVGINYDVKTKKHECVIEKWN